MTARKWSQEQALIDGKPVTSTEFNMTYCHIYCEGQGRRKRVIEFVTPGLAKFVVEALNVVENDQEKRRFVNVKLRELRKLQKANV